MSKEPNFKTYTISDLSKEFEVTPRALRLYEESGKGISASTVERDRVRLRLLLRGKRLGCTLSEIKDIFDMYESKSGEKGQILLLLEKMDDRRQKLLEQKQDVEMALEEIERVYQKVKKSLDEINASEAKK
ncbi:hypothetical protein GQR58_027363 [Nymphon striatum]|nr:hypothetical protein GQR58_027363 [Nymphon striatum]